MLICGVSCGHIWLPPLTRGLGRRGGGAEGVRGNGKHNCVSGIAASAGPGLLIGSGSGGPHTDTQTAAHSFASRALLDEGCRRPVNMHM